MRIRTMVAAVALALVGVGAPTARAAEPVTISVQPNTPLLERFSGGPCYLGEIEQTIPNGWVVLRSGPLDDRLDVEATMVTTQANGREAPARYTVGVSFEPGLHYAYLARTGPSEGFTGATNWSITVSAPGLNTATASFDGLAPAGAPHRSCDLVDATVSETIELGVPHPGEQAFTEPREYTLASGSLPPGMTVDARGGPTGTPTAVGTTNAVVQVCPSPRVGEVICANRNYELTVVESIGPGSVTRRAGGDRIDTAIATSQSRWTTAEGVVLARADDFPDAIVGAPLANRVGGPVLLTGRSSLDPRVRAELDRLLEPGDTVVLLGGPRALDPAVESAVAAAGYQVRRLAGDTRLETSVAVAVAMGSPAKLFIATGDFFPDALVAGAAAAAADGAVLLVSGFGGHDYFPEAMRAYVAAMPGGVDVTGIGGTAAVTTENWFPTSTTIVGRDRYETALEVARQLFPGSTTVGVASGAGFADALTGGADIAAAGGPLLLLPPDSVPAPIGAYLGFLPDPTSVVLYGGTAALSSGVEGAVRAAVGAA